MPACDFHRRQPETFDIIERHSHVPGFALYGEPGRARTPHAIRSTRLLAGLRSWPRAVGKMRKVIGLRAHAPRVALPPADGRDGGYRHQRAVRARGGTADLALLRALRSFASRRRYLRQSAYCSRGCPGVVGSSFPPGARVRSLRDALERERVGRKV